MSIAASMFISSCHIFPSSCHVVELQLIGWLISTCLVVTYLAGLLSIRLHNIHCVPKK